MPPSSAAAHVPPPRGRDEGRLRRLCPAGVPVLPRSHSSPRSLAAVSWSRETSLQVFGTPTSVLLMPSERADSGPGTSHRVTNATDATPVCKAHLLLQACGDASCQLRCPLCTTTKRAEIFPRRPKTDIPVGPVADPCLGPPADHLPRDPRKDRLPPRLNEGARAPLSLHRPAPRDTPVGPGCRVRRST